MAAKSNRGSKSRKRKFDREVDRRKGERLNRDARDEETYDSNKSSLNDISWYSRNPNLLAAAGSFPFPYRPGMELPIVTKAADVAIPSYQNYTIPGIMALDWTPSFGKSEYVTDPASIAGKEIYGRVRASYSGSLDADAPDYMVYLGALDSVFSYIGWLKRLYRTLTTYTPDNFYLPDGLLIAMGIMYPWQKEQLRKDKVRLYQGINELILKSRKFKCPAVMDIFNRHYWMSDNIYADAPSTRAQLYMFNLIGVWKIAEVPEASTPTNNVIGLKMTALPMIDQLQQSQGDHIVCDTLVNFGDSLLQALDAWDDCYTISGYLQRAYEGTPNFTVAELMPDELLAAQYVPEVLTQIENSRTVMLSSLYTNNWAPNTIGGLTVSQNVLTNAVVANNTVTVDRKLSDADTALFTAFPGGVAPTLSIRSEVPTVADNVIASRLHAVATYTKNGTAKTDITITAGTEIPWCWRFYTVDPSYSQVGYTYFMMPQFAAIDFKTASDATPVSSGYLGSLLNVEQWDWHPFFFVAVTAQFESMVVPLGDVHNFTVITAEALANLHKICFYSEFNSFGI